MSDAVNGVTRAWLTVVAALAIAGWVLAPAQCRAEAKCPWLNAATAAGFLGGDVEMAVTDPVDPGPVKGVGQASYADQVRIDRFDVSCTFSRKADAGVYTLHIEVKTMNDPAKEYSSFLARCKGASVPLRGVGNEAVQCVMKNSGHSSVYGEEQVIARVRERAFVLTVRREPATPPAPGEALRDDTRNIAEQVAGSMF